MHFSLKVLAALAATCVPGGYASPLLPINPGPDCDCLGFDLGSIIDLVKTGTLCCGNKGINWAYYDNDLRNTGENYPNYDPASVKTISPVHEEVTSFIGGVRGEVLNDHLEGGPIYNSSVSLDGQFYTLNHHFYLLAPVSGEYTFTATKVDDAFFLWVGRDAYSGWTVDNVAAKAYWSYDGTGSGKVTYKVTLKHGTFTPIRVVYSNAQGGGAFVFTITSPGGHTILDGTSDYSPFIIQHSCDGIIAPEFPAFGSEI
ncbi:hypothetical protein FQN55_003340 [Onygenales sp. PD_40]|nr:hypothetical protein FQN55_003340 [Onygenales sp. PD_40]